MSPPRVHHWLLGAALIARTTALAQPPPEALPLPTTTGGLTADAAARLAVRADPEIQHAGLALRQSATEARIAAAGFLPRLDLQASYTRLSKVAQPPIVFAGQTLTLSPQILDRYDAQATVTFPVSDYFLTIAPAFEASKKAAETAGYQLAARREIAAFTARQYYFAYARAIAAERVARAAVVQLETHVADLDALVKAGTATRGDAMQARAQLANARVQWSSAQGAIETSADQLRVHVGLPATAPLALDEDALQPLPGDDIDAGELTARALRTRPEAAALRALIETNQQSVAVEQGRRWPQLTVRGVYDYANPNSRVFPQQATFTASWSAIVALSWSPNDAITQQAQIGRAALEVGRAHTDLVEIERRIRSEATQAASDLRVARQQVAAAEQGVAAAREAWRVQRDLLAAREATAQQALDAQAALTRAEQSLVDARIAARIALARADYVAGHATPK